MPALVSFLFVMVFTVPAALWDWSNTAMFGVVVLGLIIFAVLGEWNERRHGIDTRK